MESLNFNIKDLEKKKIFIFFGINEFINKENKNEFISLFKKKHGDFLVVNFNLENSNDLIFEIENKSLFSNKKIIIIETINKLKKPQLLINHLEKNSIDCYLVIIYNGKSLSIIKELIKLDISYYLQSKKMTHNDVENWILSYTKRKNCTLEDNIAYRLTEVFNSDLSLIKNELDKYISASGGKITSKIANSITKETSNYNIFALNNAISSGNYTKIEKIISHFCKNQKDFPLPLIIGYLTTFFSKAILYYRYRKEDDLKISKKMNVNPYALKYIKQDYEKLSYRYSSLELFKAIEILLDYDRRSKGKYGEINDFILTKELLNRLYFLGN